MGNNLNQRVQSNAAAPRANSGERPTIFQLIESSKSEIARALPKHMDADRLARIAITVIKQTPKLGQCDPISLVGALMTCSQLGLEPGPLGEAYLVPFGQQVTFIPGYRGLIKLAWQSGMLETISANVVYEHDQFDYELGLNADMTHKPARGDRGKATDVYAVAKFKSGGYVFDVMSVTDVEAIRKRSRSSGNGPWVTDWDAMAKKTVIKRLMKFLPLSPELRTVAMAAEMDGSTRSDFKGQLEDAPVTLELPEPAPAGVDLGTGEVIDGELLPDDEPVTASPFEPTAEERESGATA